MHECATASPAVVLRRALDLRAIDRVVLAREARGGRRRPTKNRGVAAGSALDHPSAIVAATDLPASADLAHGFAVRAAVTAE
jgi:hypothetical protein